MKRWLLIITLLAVVSITGFAEGDDEMFNNKAISLEKNQRVFSIELPANPTTGYTWYLKDYDGKFVQPVKHEFKLPDEDKIGAPGVDVWTFKATNAAFEVPIFTQITFIYAQPWNLESASDNVLTLVTH